MCNCTPNLGRMSCRTETTWESVACLLVLFLVLPAVVLLLGLAAPVLVAVIFFRCYSCYCSCSLWHLLLLLLLLCCGTMESWTMWMDWYQWPLQMLQRNIAWHNEPSRPVEHSLLSRTWSFWFSLSMRVISIALHDQIVTTEEHLFYKHTHISCLAFVCFCKVYHGSAVWRPQTGFKKWNIHVLVLLRQVILPGPSKWPLKREIATEHAAGISLTWSAFEA